MLSKENFVCTHLIERKAFFVIRIKLKTFSNFPEICKNKHKPEFNTVHKLYATCKKVTINQLYMLDVFTKYCLYFDQEKVMYRCLHLSENM